MARKRITDRTGERLVRLAFEMEELANRLADEAYHEQLDVRRVSTMLGRVGRELLDTLKSRGHADEYKKSLREAVRHGPGSS